MRGFTWVFFRVGGIFSAIDSKTATEDFQESVIDVRNFGKVRLPVGGLNQCIIKSGDIVWSAITAVKMDSP